MAHATPTTTTTLRVFQTLPKEPSEMDQEEMMRVVRANQAMVFGGSEEGVAIQDDAIPPTC
eukprot:scaffold69_cov198-Alexandrium_tamarense.AAC.35